MLADLELKDKIRTEVTDDLDKQQREMLLRRQMDAIRKELGEGDDDVVAEYRAKFAEHGRCPTRCAPRSTRSSTGSSAWVAQNPEQAWVRNWLDAVLDLPWGTYATEHADLDAARAVLDADHEGLDDVKERILEFLAVRVLRQRARARARGERPRFAVRSSGWSVLRVSARRRSVSRSRVRSAVRSCASPSVVCATRPRSAVTGVPTSVRGPVASSAR